MNNPLNEPARIEIKLKGYSNFVLEQMQILNTVEYVIREEHIIFKTERCNLFLINNNSLFTILEDRYLYNIFDSKPPLSNVIDYYNVHMRTDLYTTDLNIIDLLSNLTIFIND
jgi:hypothetical protein